jgi:hypothetical protein
VLSAWHAHLHIVTYTHTQAHTQTHTHVTRADAGSGTASGAEALARGGRGARKIEEREECAGDGSAGLRGGGGGGGGDSLRGEARGESRLAFDALAALVP